MAHEQNPILYRNLGTPAPTAAETRGQSLRYAWQERGLGTWLYAAVLTFGAISGTGAGALFGYGQGHETRNVEQEKPTFVRIQKGLAGEYIPTGETKKLSIATRVQVSDNTTLSQYLKKGALIGGVTGTILVTGLIVMMDSFNPASNYRRRRKDVSHQQRQR
jgi:hypothetical protein